ncbi:hypothetical protein [Caulobacter sp. NIBR2454]|uniref:hypothetical protein n=1 Tax=Caulobacter sp. NIBR2454 TaxID=3015996 RepID=UPI0022B6F730|nr:hypothetical protein [Caulobacter sp. NIBR2454]
MAKDASEDVSELFRRIAQPELGYKSFDLALQDEEAATVADVKKLARKREDTSAAKAAPAAAPTGGGKLLRAWSPEPAPAPEPVVKLVADNTEARTELKAMFSALSKVKTPRSGR